MNKQIKKHLEARGVRFEKGMRTDGLFGTDESAAGFFKWFFENVMRFDSLEYRRQFWRAASEYGHTIGDMPRTAYEFTDPRQHPYHQWFANLIFMMTLMGVSAVLWFLVKASSRHLRRLRRPTYYEIERERRLQFAEERRRIRKRSTTNPCPTPHALRTAFERARYSPANMLHFGSLLEDLECFVNNMPYWSLETGRIVGRHGGIRQWLRDHAPDLSARYKTVMRYKALAKKFRQAVGLHDPTPASAVLPPADETPPQKEHLKDSSSASIENENIARTKGRALGNVTNRTAWKRGTGRVEHVLREGHDGCSGIVDEILGACEGTVVSLEACLALYVGVAFIPQDHGCGYSQVHRNERRKKCVAG
jgi:hypothetical protein